MREKISGAERFHYSRRASEMWTRAMVIFRNESTNPKIAVAVMRDHLGEYKNVPSGFLELEFEKRLLSAARNEREILENNPQLVPDYVASVNAAMQMLHKAGIMGADVKS